MYVVQIFEVNSMILLILEHIVKDKNKKLNYTFLQ